MLTVSHKYDLILSDSIMSVIIFILEDILSGDSDDLFQWLVAA